MSIFAERGRYRASVCSVHLPFFPIILFKLQRGGNKINSQRLFEVGTEMGTCTLRQWRFWPTFMPNLTRIKSKIRNGLSTFCIISLISLIVILINFKLSPWLARYIVLKTGSYDFWFHQYHKISHIIWKIIKTSVYSKKKNKKNSLGYVCNHVKILDKTSNNWNLTHMTPGEIGTIVHRIVLRFWYPNFCHGV